MKRIFLLSTGVLFLCISLLISSCDEGNDEIINFKTLNLDSPQNIKLDTLNRTLTWDVVPNASSYSVKHSLLDFSPATAISNSYYFRRRVCRLLANVLHQSQWKHAGYDHLQ